MDGFHCYTCFVGYWNTDFWIIMKQHITRKQFNSLKSEQRAKLRKWILEHYPQTAIEMNLSIGQMIEFLDENTAGDTYIDKYFDHNVTDKLGGSDSVFAVGWDGEELCDALWEVVKEVLKK